MSRPHERSKALRFEEFPDKLLKQIEAGKNIAALIAGTVGSKRPTPELQNVFPGIDRRYRNTFEATRSIRRAIKADDVSPRLITAHGEPIGVASWITARPKAIVPETEIDDGPVGILGRSVGNQDIRNWYHGDHNPEGASQVAYWLDWEYERGLDDAERIEVHGFIGGLMVHSALTDNDYVWGLVTHEKFEPAEGLYYHLRRHGGPNQFAPAHNAQQQHIEEYDYWLHDHVNGQLTSTTIQVR